MGLPKDSYIYEKNKPIHCHKKRQKETQKLLKMKTVPALFSKRFYTYLKQEVIYKYLSLICPTQRNYNL